MPKFGSGLTRVVGSFARVGRRFPRWGKKRTPSVAATGSASAQETVGSGGPPDHPVGQVFARDGLPPIAVVDLGRELSAALRASWDDGRPPESGGLIESAWVQPCFAAGSTAAASLASGNLFMATANPETLMAIGEGVGSAILSGGRIVGHAPFIAVGSAVVPVVAPLMLFATVSSLITGARLERIQKEIGTLSEVVGRLRRVMEAEAYAKFQSAAEQLDEIGSQFEHGQCFTDAMKMELVQAKGSMNELRSQFGFLADRKIRSASDARTAMADINLFFLASIMDLRADVLRLHLTLQDAPSFAGRRRLAVAANVAERLGEIRKLIQENPIEGFYRRLERASSEGLWARLKRRLPNWLWGKPPAALKEVQKVREDFQPVRERMERWVRSCDSAIGAGSEQAILVYRDDAGALCARRAGDLRLRRKREENLPAPM